MKRLYNSIAGRSRSRNDALTNVPSRSNTAVRPIHLGAFRQLNKRSPRFSFNLLSSFLSSGKNFSSDISNCPYSVTFGIRSTGTSLISLGSVFLRLSPRPYLTSNNWSIVVQTHPGGRSGSSVVSGGAGSLYFCFQESDLGSMVMIMSVSHW